MGNIFGIDQPAKLHAPKASSDWNIESIVKKGEYQNVILYSFSLSDREIVDIKRCFNDVTHIFAHGRDVRSAILNTSLLFFIGQGCVGIGEGGWLTPADIHKLYDESRISKKKEPINVTIDTTTFSGYLIAMDVHQIDPVAKTGVITFQFLLDKEV